MRRCDVYLKALTLKGFKSFPERTRLDFGPGVSVVIGPNGSGKSNITDAVLWALGEQSPLAVRGSSMQDVIFGGGPGVQARSAAEVELVLDNADAAVGLPASEVSIVRRLERSGEGEYRLGGARCRLIDVIEALSDTGLGKETHSIVSQGRIETIVTSKPRDRRLLIEEAAGLSKHRKRRRRAQSKLERTQQNLDRALDVEREARSRLRPLGRQAQAAELHERLQRQMLEARLELTTHAWVDAEKALASAQSAVKDSREERAGVESELATVLERRTGVEHALAERSERHDAITHQLYGVRAAFERLRVRSEQAATLEQLLSERIATGASEIAGLQAAGEDEDGSSTLEAERRVRALEEELTAVRRGGAEELREQTAELDRERDRLVPERQRVQAELAQARSAHEQATERLHAERAGRMWENSWSEVRRVIADGVRRVLGLPSEREREQAANEVVDHAERVARAVIERALGDVGAVEEEQARSERGVSALERALADLDEQARRTEWLIEQRRAAAEHGPMALRRAQIEGELAAERRQLERLVGERATRAERLRALTARRASDLALVPLATRLMEAIALASEAATEREQEFQAALAGDLATGAEIADQLAACAQEEAGAQARLRAAGEEVTNAEVNAQRANDRATEVQDELREIADGLGLALEQASPVSAQGPSEEEVEALTQRLERLQRRRDQLGPVNPLAQQEYADAQAHVQELAGQREDLEAALRELRSVIREADRQIRETFEATFASVARNFEEVIGEAFPGGSGRLRLVDDEVGVRPVLGDAAVDEAPEAADAAAAAEEQEEAPPEVLQGVEIEVTPAGKSTKRLSLLSGGEKAMTALAFLFAVFLARPCPFYVLDEVEAALDEHNLDRFLALLRRCATRAQFIVITHQKRTMEAANWLYGVSMGADGTSRVVSRRLEESTESTVAGDERGAAWAASEPAANVAPELQALAGGGR